MNNVLTIAGSDSGGGAGIQADLQTFHDFGVYGATAITAMTAQNRQRVGAIFKSPANFVAEQVDFIMADINPYVWKTGMLVNKAIIKTVVKKAEQYSIKSLVIDPVMVSTSGTRLLTTDSIKCLIESLIPLSLVVTPNIPEAEVLAGKKINNIADMKKAAVIIHHLGAKNVVVKGGHLTNNFKAVDIFFDGRKFHELASKRIVHRHLHGGGCRFASAIAANIVEGDTVLAAVSKAKRYLHQFFT